MKKYCVIVLLLGCFCNVFAELGNVSFTILKTKPKNDSIYHLLVTFISICNLNTSKVFIYDYFYNSRSFAAIAKVRPQISVLVYTKKIEWQRTIRHSEHKFKIDTVIIVLSRKNLDTYSEDLFRKWPDDRNCIVYIFPAPSSDCESYKEFLELIMRFYFIKAYFICRMKNRSIHVYTHDPYGDTEPLYWKKIDQSLIWGKNWTFYERSYDTDASQLCPGFDFRRTDPMEQKNIVIGLNRRHIKQQKIKNEEAYSNVSEQDLSNVFRKQITCLKKQLNVKFQYYTVDFSSKPEETEEQSYNDSVVDLLFILKRYVTSIRWDYLHPTYYEHIVIISHHRGFMTPLEKIANFYGKWTLSSLVVIMIIASTVMWFSTRKLNLAFFNALRLLINAEIITPMNTGALKLFFSMIFLYFLIIHATFSGHLAEFLTKVQVRPNIDTLDQLYDPRVEKIYNGGFQFNSDKKFNDLINKVKNVRITTECYQIINETKSVCIVPITTLYSMVFYLRLKRKMIMNDFYTSKNTFGTTFAGYRCKPGFPVCDKFRWALMSLFELGLMMRYLVVYHQSYIKTVARYDLAINLNYRPVQLNDVYFAFFILIIGNFIGSLCFLLEILFKRRCSKSNINLIQEINVANIDVIAYE